MFWFGLLLAVVSLGRVALVLVLLGVLLWGDGADRGSLPVLVSAVAGLFAIAYVVWFAFVGHRQLRDVPASDTARRIVVAYGVLVLAAVPLVDLGAYRYGT